MKTFLIISFLFLISCKSNFALDGNYKKVGSDFTYTLNLNKDSTFILTQKYFEVNAKCSGKWKVNKNQEVLLECSEVPIIEQLQSGYLSDRKIKLQILKNNKLKLKNVVLAKDLIAN